MGVNCIAPKGKIVEQGTHKELLAKKGTYALMWKRQQEHKDESISSK